jgi:hypothetical protein
MYKPRIVTFNDGHGTDWDVDTRKGKNGFYPGDLIHIGSLNFLVLGISCETGNLVSAGKGFITGHVSGLLDLVYDLAILIKRNANKKIMRDMIQA